MENTSWIRDRQVLKIKELKNESILLGILVVIFLASRILFLDSDIPSWKQTNYSPIDEFYYTTQAFDIVEGVHSPDGKLLSSQYSAYNIIEQLTTAGTLYLLGDNYYGLRMPSVIAGLIVLICFYLIILKRFGLAYAVTSSFFLILEQSFTLATRIAEPTIFRMAAAAILLLIITKQDYTEKNHIRAIGFATCFAWLFIYPTNAFLGLFGLIVIAYSNPKKIFASTSHYITGFIFCALIYLISYYSLGNTFSDLITTKTIFAERVLSDENNSFISFIIQACTKLRDIRQANFFRQHPVFFIATVLSLMFVTRLFIKQSKLLTRTDKIIFIFGICFLLQCAFINDYPRRKLIFILPICAYLVMLTINTLLKKAPEKRSKFIYIAIVAISTPFLLVPTYNNIYKDPQYSYKNSMKELSYLNNERIIGGWGYGFRLYNDYKPYLNQYTIIYTNPEHYYQLLNDAGKLGNAKFTIEYGDEKTESTLNSIGFHKERLAYKSNDKIYPDVYIYKYSDKKQLQPIN